jgi:tRNA-Thr(GGU) m(6)t(6)A37 methyltransferase TsaA
MTGSTRPPGERPPREFRLRAIGVVRTPHTDAARTPIQPVYAEGIRGTAEIRPELAEGLRDLDGFSHLHLIYFLHRAGDTRLVVTPFLDDAERGVFATRAPWRPNKIGLSLVRLVRREGTVLHLEDVDILDETPLLDIKPFVPTLDSRADARCGWFEHVDQEEAARRGRRE